MTAAAAPPRRPSSLWRPGRLRPMLARAAPAPFDHPDWLFEVKWDGYRCLAFIGDGLFLQSRNGRDMTSRFPQLAPLAEAAAAPTVLDGELVALRDGQPDFHALGPWVRRQPGTAAGLREGEAGPVTIQYVAFDILHTGGQDLIHLPLERRRDLLSDLLDRSPGLREGWMRISEAIPAAGTRLYRGAAALGLEGVMAKLRSSRYEPGRRTSTWLKIRRQKESDFVIAGVIPGRQAGGFGAFLLGAFDGRGRLWPVGRVGAGLDAPQIGAILRDLKARADSPFYSQKGTGSHPSGTIFVEPRVVARVEFHQWTPEGRLRHPVFRGRKPGVHPSDCVLPPGHPLGREGG